MSNTLAVMCAGSGQTRIFPLTPDKITYGSNKIVWWKADCGHEWRTLISTRSGGSRCPYCSGITLLKKI